MAANNVFADTKMQQKPVEEFKPGEIVDPDSQVASVNDSRETGAFPPVLPSSTSADIGKNDIPRGEDMHGNASKEGEIEGTDPQIVSFPANKWRFQVRLVNGQFNPGLKDALFRDLNNCLYSDPCSSFIPSFGGSGLRFGVVWFSPDDEHSYNWLIDKLTAINEKAGEFRFTIEGYSAHQNKVCIRIPWDPKEGLRDANVLKRIKFQNPKFPTDNWKVSNSKITNLGDKLLFCSIDDASLKLLQKQKFRLNYGFQKIQVDVLQQKKTDRSKKQSVNSRMENANCC